MIQNLTGLTKCNWEKFRNTKSPVVLINKYEGQQLAKVLNKK